VKIKHCKKSLHVYTAIAGMYKYKHTFDGYINEILQNATKENELSNRVGWRCRNLQEYWRI